MTPETTERCTHCEPPETAHREPHRAYAALVGVHDWTPDTAPPVRALARVETDRPVQVPRIVPHPEGGVTHEWVPEWPAPPPEPTPTAARETPSDQLPARAKPAATSTTDRPGIIRRIWAATNRRSK